MIRQLDDLTGRAFDLLVVGGGIYGLTLAYDAAQRGLSVALLERDDFGCGSSFNHLRTIHGGLRYLQALDIRRARESVRERRTLARIAPHTVRPVPFALPLWRSLLTGKLALRAGALLDGLVAADRNRGVPYPLRLPRARVLSRSAVSEHFPAVLRPGVTGAAVWHDYVTIEADRLTFAWALAAAGCGATLANHVEATALLTEGRRVTGVNAVDTITGRDLTVAARVTVCTAAASLQKLIVPLGVSRRTPLVAAMNLVTRRDAAGPALGGRTRAGRHLFLVPWRGRAVIGTWQSTTTRDDGAPTVTAGDIGSFIAEINEAFPALDLRSEDVTLVHRGLVPGQLGRDGTARLDGHEQLRDYAREGHEGLISVAGAKYTTARAVAERVTNHVFTALGRSSVSCRTAVQPLPGGNLHDPALLIGDARREHDRALPDDTIPHLVAAYGTNFPAVLKLAAERPEWRSRVADDSPVIGAQLVWAVRHEMALSLLDAVVRRTPIGALGYPGDAAAERAAAVMGAELRWSNERRREEVAALRAFYRIPT